MMQNEETILVEQTIKLQKNKVLKKPNFVPFWRREQLNFVLTYFIMYDMNNNKMGKWHMLLFIVLTKYK